jgi:hypothetical protein
VIGSTVNSAKAMILRSSKHGYRMTQNTFVHCSTICSVANSCPGNPPWPKKRQNEEVLCFQELDVLFRTLEVSPGACLSMMYEKIDALFPKKSQIFFLKICSLFVTKICCLLPDLEKAWNRTQ